MEYVLNFFDSNFFVSLMTLIVGGFAIYLYNKRKRDYKRDAARTLYYEISYSEKIFEDVKAIKAQDNLLSIDTKRFYLGENSWDKYKYLFVNDFTAQEWEKLNTFYIKRTGLNNTIKEIGSLSAENIRARTEALHSKLSDIASDYMYKKQKIEDEASDEKDKQTKLEGLSHRYLNITFQFKDQYVNDPKFSEYYAPKLTFAYINRSIDSVNTNISTSNIGMKLKRLGKVK